MSELERLTTAIVSMQKANVPEGVYGVEYDAVLNAARAYRDLLANGQRVEWCETHGAPVTHDDQGPNPDCVRHEWEPRDPDEAPELEESCRVVSKLLSVYPKEEGNP